MTALQPGLPLCCVFLLLSACGDNASLPAVHLQGMTMGTGYDITLVDPAADAPLGALEERIRSTLDTVENLASTYRKDSQLTAFNNNPSTDWIAVSPPLCGLVSRALQLGEQTNGAFDITIGTVVNLWGFGPPPESGKLPTDAEIDAAMQHVGQRKLQADCSRPALRKSNAETYLDLSGWAKGYAVDQVAVVLDEHALHNYLIEIGGEIRVKGHNTQARPFLIGIEDPASGTTSVNRSISLTNRSMATSGDYRNFHEHGGRRYSHTIDPRSGRPITHQLASVTVVSETAAYADGMATALLVLGTEMGIALANERNIAAYFIVRTEAGFSYHPSAAFATLLQQQE